ncbi:hypothetical protein B0A55_02938 [Friedmanniomyces simplex]|uniref:Zn(2)-C6 fungal-type domain-containing protein n=1 Tax=Friedmanniomyces simplex TaxID=329884 RepID=A0A4U0Y0I8_9PEZI|nr:hypothetical protein B0A55_02938 [Friedmanniomyces simplex]
MEATVSQQQRHQQQRYPHSTTANGQYPEAYREHGQSSQLRPLHSYSEVQTAMQQPPLYAAAVPMNGAQMHHPPPPTYPPATPQYQYQHHNGAMQPAPMPSNGNGGMMRYPIAQASSEMSGVRGKKEIKRRTKSGCLTCRKRRIKCDEGQPLCRNCAKSKRECLGYDPIFKPQTGPTPIQPAPAAAVSTSVAPTLNPTVTSPLSTTSYQTQYHYPVAGGAYVPAHDYDGPAEYATPLDPDLGSGERHQVAMSHSNNYPSMLSQERRVRALMIDDLFSLDDVPPRYDKREIPSLVSPPVQQEVADFYTFHYAPGLDALLETTWYTTHGLAQLQSNTELQDFVAQCTQQFKASTDNPAMAAQIRSLEARLVWELAKMPRSSPSPTDVVARLDILENLLTGHFLDPGRIPPPPSAEFDDVRYNKHLFWHHLALFTAARDDHRDPAAHHQIEDSLAEMRRILHMLENRDVLYSVAVGRHIGGRMPGFHPQRHLVASTPDPHDEVNKLKIAVHFVQQEDEKGTTQVIQRVCSMALRAWALQKQ